MIELYKNIKNRRIELKMTQSELAEKVGYADKGMISRVENGKIDLSQSQIVKFADALDISPKELLGWQDDDPETALLRAYKRNIEMEMYWKLVELKIYQRLLDAAKDCPPEQIEKAIDILNSYKQTENEKKELQDQINELKRQVEANYNNGKLTTYSDPIPKDD